MFWSILQKIEKSRLKTKRVSVGHNLVFGPGGRIWAPRQLIIGNDVSLGSYVRIELDGFIGDQVLIANNVGLVGRTDHDMHEVGKSVRYSKWVGDFPEILSTNTIVGSDTWIGYGATVLSGVVIGDSCVIGAGALVVDDVPENSVVVGVPARVIGKRFSSVSEYENHWSSLKQNGVRPIDEIITSYRTKEEL